MAITRVSTASDGTQGDIDSFSPSLSADGTAVAFQSNADNLVSGDTNGQEDVFVKNLATGAITRVSTASDGTQGDDFSTNASLSADGTKVAFQSAADNLVTGDTNGTSDVFVKNLTTGAVTRVSTDTNGVQGNANSVISSISADGTKVAFVSLANNLVAGDTNGAGDVFVKDLTSGMLTRVSTAADGTQGNDLSSVPSLSADGTKVAFGSNADNLVPGDTNGTSDVFVKNLATGAITRVSTAADGTQGDGATFYSTISADGTKVAFESSADNLVPGDTNGVDDIFVKDLATGAITRVSVSANGTQGNGTSTSPSLSADGTKVAFTSSADNLVPGDTNGTDDVFVKDLTTGAITRISVSANGTQGDGNSLFPSLSANGAKLAFESGADNLVPGDTNGDADIFVADVPCFATGTLIRTDDGEVAVEHLAVGDRVVTASGARRAIRWLGHRTMNCRWHPRPREAHPIRISAHAFGINRPTRDLYVSPGHAICVNLLSEVLIPAAALVNGTTIRQRDVESVTYWHVELDSHDILLAENLPCESYLEMGNRGFFREAAIVGLAANPDVGGTSRRTHADFCRPFHADGPFVEAARARLQGLALTWRTAAVSAARRAG